MKKVLVLCTGNSCRSIIAEALINRYLKGVRAKSSGVRATKKVNKNARKVLIQNGCWSNKYYSKTIDMVLDKEFDLVVTVCDNAKENCPIFPKITKVIHIGFIDPDKKEYKEFIKTFLNIKKILLPLIKKEL